MRRPRPFYRVPLKRWYVQIDGKQIPLGDDPKPKVRDGKYVPPQPVVDLYEEIMAVRQSTQVQTRAGTSVLVVEILEKFLDDVQANREPRTYEWYRHNLETFAKGIPKDLSVAELRKKHVTEIVNAREWKANTKRGFLRCVQRAFRWALEEGHIATAPFGRVEKPEPEARDVVISPEEYALILEIVTEPCLRDLIVTAWETGARPRELRMVEAKHVQLEHGRWVFPRKQAKGKKSTRAVYLNDTALEITRRLAAQHPTGPLFRNSDGEPWHRWAVNCAFQRLRLALGRRILRREEITLPPIPRFNKANVEPKNLKAAREAQAKKLQERQLALKRLALKQVPQICLGTFRHSFGDRLLKAGVDPITVANLMGHRNLAMLANVYSHLSHDTDYLREAAKRATVTVANA